MPWRNAQDSEKKAAERKRTAKKQCTGLFKDAEGDIANEFWVEVSGTLQRVTEGLTEVIHE